MKKLLVLAALSALLTGCAVGVIAGAGAMDSGNRIEMQRMACMTRHGFLPAFEHGWIHATDPSTGAKVMQSALHRAYIQRVVPDSYASKSLIGEGDLILAVNGIPVVDSSVLETMTETNGAKFSQMTLKNGTRGVYVVHFSK